MNAAMQRERLPNRRQSEVAEFELGGIRYRAAVSRFPDGRLGELFLDGPKVGSSAQIAAHDAAIAASLALQYGCPAEVLHRAPLKLADGRAAGPVGAALEIFAEGADA